jgi:flagellin
VVGLDVTTFQKASSAMDTISTAVDLVSAARSKIGAQQNRLEHTIANEDNIVENMTDAESRIRDADMAEEMTAYSTANIIAQAVEAMIAQANSSTEGILTLLG